LQRYAALPYPLESRQPPPISDNSEYLQGALRSLSERLDRIPVGNDNAAAFAHLEQRVTYLLERLETSGNPRSGDFGRVEEGLQDILRHLERQHANLVSLADTTRNFSAPAPQPAMTPAWSRSSSANCPISATASRKPTAARRICSKPFTTRSAMWSIAWR
jgi:localization factor PodJL